VSKPAKDPASRAEYERRMHRVLAHIDRHIDGDLDLAVLADVACFSRFHFHRVFSTWMGETLGDYLRRRRLEIAAMRLAAQPMLGVTEAALAVGFGSAEAFSRAFRERFGDPPTVWRQQQATRSLQIGNSDQANSNPDQAPHERGGNHGGSHQPQRETANMNVRLIDRQPVTVAYLRRMGAYGIGLSEFWGRTVAPWMATNGLFGRPRYGISYDDPSITAPERCRYDACVEVAPDFIVSGNALRTEIPGGRYAVLPFAGSAAQIGDAWSALLRDWLPSSGLQLDARPCFEYYPADANYDCATGAFTCDICIPVAPL
jgi:AraC family transcriptional regulator